MPLHTNQTPANRLRAGNCRPAGEAVFGTIIRRTQQSVQQLDHEAREVTSAPVERVQVYPFAIRPKSGVLELYAASAASVKFACPMGKATARITPNACFSFACHEEDRPVVMSILRKLL